MELLTFRNRGRLLRFTYLFILLFALVFANISIIIIIINW